MNEMPFIETKRKVGRRTASSLLKYMGGGRELGYREGVRNPYKASPKRFIKQLGIGPKHIKSETGLDVTFKCEILEKSESSDMGFWASDR
jgi:hypothetical protein